MIIERRVVFLLVFFNLLKHHHVLSFTPYQARDALTSMMLHKKLQKPWTTKIFVIDSSQVLFGFTKTISSLRISISLHDDDEDSFKTNENFQTEKKPTTNFSWQNQWYPVMPISYLNGLESNKPVSITVLGKNLVIWKSSSNQTNNEQWSIFEDICPHRRAPLSTGQVVDGCLMCRYHGWEFDADGYVAKFPMLSENNNSKQKLEIRQNFRANSFPSQVSGMILWVFLGGRGAVITELPVDSIANEHEYDGANWMFNRNPISYISMMENTFDPAHSPWTHEDMVGFAGLSFSPNDTIPMKQYSIIDPPTKLGFTLHHTPYQNSISRRAPNSITIRRFIPPCTVHVSSPPFFVAKLWFVPSTPYETNVMAFFKTTETRYMKWIKKCFPIVHEFYKDTRHTMQYINDWNYRFLSQDRITMQGQDVRKLQKTIKDLTPDISDTGVATFQSWIQNIANKGPFSSTDITTTIQKNNIHHDPSLFPSSKVMSFWESHGKYCPRCQRSMNRITWLKKWSNQYANKLMIATIISTLITTGGVIISTTKMTTTFGFSNKLTKIGLIFILNMLVSSIGLRRIVDWCREKENRMYDVGVDLWSPQKSVFGYPQNKKIKQSKI